jgi:hypothetical protein
LRGSVAYFRGPWTPRIITCLQDILWRFWKVLGGSDKYCSYHDPAAAGSEWREPRSGLGSRRRLLGRHRRRCRRRRVAGGVLGRAALLDGFLAAAYAARCRCCVHPGYAQTRLNHCERPLCMPCWPLSFQTTVVVLYWRPVCSLESPHTDDSDLLDSGTYWIWVLESYDARHFEESPGVAGRLVERSSARPCLEDLSPVPLPLRGVGDAFIPATRKRV